MSAVEYNKRGRARSLLTREDSANLNSAIAEAFNLRGKNSDIRLKDGTFAIEVNNKIVYVSGTFSNPRYDLVLVFDADNATEMEVLKDAFFSELKNKEILKNDILRWIKQRRSYGSIYGFNAENYKASSKQNFGRASC